MGVTTYYKEIAITQSLTDLNSVISHFATGDDNTTPVVTDTALGNETFREALYNTVIGSNNIEFQSFQDISENNGNNIEEAGILDLASGGNLYGHALTNIIVKDSSTEVFLGYRIFIVS